jgi:enoyl-CoA hydratase
MRDYTDFQHLTVEITDGIAVIASAPKDGLGRHVTIFRDLHDALVTADRDLEVNAVVLTGTTDAFFGGMPPSAVEEISAGGVCAMSESLLEIRQLWQQFTGFRKPLVAAVNGSARNFGMQVAALCDAAVCAPESTFGDHHITGGAAAGDGGTMIWPVLLGLAAARQVLLQQKPISADKALELHLVSSVVANADVLTEAIALASRLAAMNPVAYHATKLALNNAFRAAALTTVDLALGLEVAGWAAADFSSKDVLDPNANGAKALKASTKSTTKAATKVSARSAGSRVKR